ncbi:hypothetical protein Tcan_08995 [Toxocara canis]|uniref:Uncharacterized protein n=1 Tax=Toxocara canis TaxID=6265 RepID=A0A0B2VLF9_TOXCA|nr:hypothetical protein Tcan_08995 [Toxocara canis]
MAIGFSYKMQCAANWHGFTCSKFCKPFNDSWRCYTCEPITGKEVCCTGIIPKTDKCWRNATLATTATNETPTATTCTGINSDHADLYFWLAIGLACFSLLMVLVAATVTILAVHFYRNSKRAVLAARCIPYRMNYAISNGAPWTTHLEETHDSDTGPKDNFSYSYTSDDTLDSWPREVERREARV